ncbi:TetR/AcrR family transcriptional regulator [Streptomyces coeruleorubidus]
MIRFRVVREAGLPAVAVLADAHERRRPLRITDLSASIQTIAEAVDERLREAEAPAEFVAAGLRLSARMVDSHPELMRVLRHRGLGHIHSDRGLAPRAPRDLERGVTEGRFVAVDPTVALSALGGSLLSLVELRFARPELDADETAAGLAEMILRMLGVPPDDARDIARRPLPDLA